MRSDQGPQYTSKAFVEYCEAVHTVGVKLPWTLNDTENWNKTNRLAGWLFVLVGFLRIMAVLTGGILLPTAATILTAVIPAGYSLALYLRKSGYLRNSYHRL